MSPRTSSLLFLALFTAVMFAGLPQAMAQSGVGGQLSTETQACIACHQQAATPPTMGTSSTRLLATLTAFRVARFANRKRRF